MSEKPYGDEFEWDQGNIHKSYKKHGIAPNEAEQIFVDEYVIVLPDVRHSQREDRYVALGKTIIGRLLFIVYTVRSRKIRIVSARPADKKERRLYEETKKNPPL